MFKQKRPKTKLVNKLVVKYFLKNRLRENFKAKPLNSPLGLYQLFIFAPICLIWIINLYVL